MLNKYANTFEHLANSKQYWQGYLDSRKAKIRETDDGASIKVLSSSTSHLKKMQDCFGVCGELYPHPRKTGRYVLKLTSDQDVLPVLESLQEMSKVLPPVSGAAEVLSALKSKKKRRQTC